eukprot:11051728-Alexandrium_andersonii.AAC.1
MRRRMRRRRKRRSGDLGEPSERSPARNAAARSAQCRPPARHSAQNHAEMERQPDSAKQTATLPDDSGS